MQKIITKGLATDPKSGSYKLATKLQAKVDSGEKVSDYDLGLAVLTIDKEIRNEVYEAEGVEEKGTKAPYDVEKAPAEFLGAVDNRLVSFVEKVENNEEGVPLSYVFGKTTDRLNADIKKLTGIDTTDYRHSVGKNSIRHIINGHGKNGKTDRSMANNDDIGRIGYVLDNYDDIELLDDTSKEFRNKNQRPAPMVRMSKRVDGTFYVVEAVPDAKAKKLAVVTAYIEKPSQQTRDVQAPLWIVRNASADNGSMDSIPTNGENVNGNVSEMDKGGVPGAESLALSDDSVATSPEGQGKQGEATPITPGFRPSAYSRKIGNKTLRALDAIGKKLGVEITIGEPTGEGGENGKYENGRITIAQDAENPLAVVLAHEVTHT